MRNRLIVIVPVLILCALGLGCREVAIEYSKEITERATVVDLVYTPSRHGTGAGPTFDITGDGGLGIAVTSVNVPERYAVVFRCQHGKFIVQGDQQKTKEHWNRLTEGQEVTVRYREVYEVVYEDDKPVEKSLVKYDFIDAR